MLNPFRTTSVVRKPLATRGEIQKKKNAGQKRGSDATDVVVVLDHRRRYPGLRANFSPLHLYAKFANNQLSLANNVIDTKENEPFEIQLNNTTHT